MTKLEFYDNLRKCNSYWFKDENSFALSCYKDIIREKKHKKPNYCGPPSKNIRKLIKEYVSVTYKAASSMYDFLVENNLSFDFYDNFLVIHYPEIILEKSKHLIRDLYLFFNPVMKKDLIGLKCFGKRSTYTVSEAAEEYCHPHIRFHTSPDIRVCYNICFGETPFIIGESYELNFYRFILYLESFLKHETQNAYRSTFEVYNNNIGNSLNPIIRYKLKNLNWSKVNMKFSSINGNIFIEIDEQNLAKSKIFPELKKVFGKEMFVKEFENQLFDDTKEKKALRIKGLSCGFTFKGKKIKFKILSDGKTKINPNWEKWFRRECAVFLTEKYMEAFSKNFGECDETSEVPVLENTG